MNLSESVPCRGTPITTKNPSNTNENILLGKVIEISYNVDSGELETCWQKEKFYRGFYVVWKFTYITSTLCEQINSSGPLSVLLLTCNVQPTGPRVTRHRMNFCHLLLHTYNRPKVPQGLTSQRRPHSWVQRDGPKRDLQQRSILPDIIGTVFLSNSRNADHETSFVFRLYISLFPNNYFACTKKYDS